jgi:type II secretory ATPase GspE/PulE/Tfp pilus assembly ATPase PilB-like protein
LIEEAIHKCTSDIHIETRGSYAQVYFRIFGERVEQAPMSKATATDICNALYTVHGDADNKSVAWNPKVVQSTAIEYKSKSGKHVQLRFESGPIYPAENFQCVMRVLVMDEQTIRPLEDIGYTPQQVEAIEEMLLGAQGLVILVGPTNSGKSTSMQAFLQRTRERRGDTIKIETVEDPVEYIIPGACQMGVPRGRTELMDSATGSIFTTFLKSTLRHDPDVVMVGEVRDQESAESVKNQVLAGLKVVTTLHVFEVFAVFTRLRELGVPPSVLFMHNFISGVIYQRLVPVVCPHCAISVGEAMKQGRLRNTTFERLSRVVDLHSDNVRVRGVGCRHCNYAGIIGRTPCAELLVPDDILLGMLSRGDETGARQYWLSREELNVDGRGVTAVAHAIQKMRQGMLDPTDIEKFLGKLVAETPLLDVRGQAKSAYRSFDFPPSLQD